MSPGSVWLTALGISCFAACGDALRLPDGGASRDGAVADAGHPADAATPGDGVLDDGATEDAGVLDGGGDAGADHDAAGAIVTADYAIIPRGAGIILTGSDLASVTAVSLGGVAQEHTVDSSSQITIQEVAATTPLGLADLVVVTSSGPRPALVLEVIELAFDPGVVAHGGVPMVTATGLVTSFDGTATLALGGVAQPVTASSATTLAVGPIADATPTGTVEVAVVTAGIAIAPVSVPVIHLVLNEADPDQAGFDTHEYVEIAAGQPGVSLAGYVLVFFAGTTDSVYLALDLSTGSEVTNTGGLLLAGNSAVGPPPALVWDNNLLASHGAAIAIYQGSAAGFPNGSPVTSVGLIDALVHGSGDPDDQELLVGLLGAPAPGAVQVDEDINGAENTESISRCGAARLDGRVFAVGARTPSATNSCP